MTEKNNYAIDCGIGIIAGCATKASLSKTSGSIAEKFIGDLHKRQGLWKQATKTKHLLQLPSIRIRSTTNI